MINKIFLTGSSGFLGSQLLKILRFSGYDVYEIPRSYSLMSEIDFLRLFEKKSEGSTLIHAAAAGVVQATRFEECAKVNIISTNDLVRAAVNNGIEHVIVCGTCFEYGRTGNAVEQLKEIDALDPIGNYAFTKACSFLSLESLYSETLINISYLRIFQIFGDCDFRARLYPDLLSAAILGQDFAMSKGSQLRDFVHVDDVCSCILSIIGANNGWQVLNVSTGIATSVYDFACFHWERLEAKGRLVRGEILQKSPEIFRLVGEPSDLFGKLVRPFNLFPYE